MGRKVLAGVVTVVFVMLFSESTIAATLHLKNGATLKGRIVRVDGQKVLVEIPGSGQQTLQLDDVASMAFEAGETPWESWKPATPPPTPSEIRQLPEWKELNARLAGPDGKLRRDLTQPPSGLELNAWLAGLDEEERFKVVHEAGSDSLQATKQVFGADSSQVEDVLSAQVRWCLQYGKFAEAEPLMAQLTEKTEKRLGPNDPILAAILDEYARVLRQVGKIQEAETIETRAKRIRSHQPGK